MGFMMSPSVDPDVSGRQNIRLTSFARWGIMLW